MSGHGSWGKTPQHAAVIKAVSAYVRAYGIKRGLHLAAQAIGMGERAARHAHEGDHFAADKERAARADAARLRLLNEQIAQLRAEAETITTRGMHVEMAGPSLDSGCGVLRGARDSLLPSREVTR